MTLLAPPSALPPVSIVDAYLRDSGGPSQERSTGQQRKEIEAYCAAHGLTLRNVFCDEAKSGASTAGRDDFNRMLDTYRAPAARPNGLLLWNYARFARDLDDAIYYKSLLKAQGISVHSLTDPIPEGRYGRIVEFFIDISNEEKRRQTSTDAKRGLRDLVLSHGCVPGTPPRGFRRVPVEIGKRRDGSARIAHRWEPDPAMAGKVRRAFELKAAGVSLSQIQRETRLYGSLNSYRTFFINPIYTGVLHFGDLVVESYCEALVDIKTWKSVQEILKAAGQRHNPVKTHPRRTNSIYLLSGLALCDACGAPLYGNTVTRPTREAERDEAYRCSRGRRKRDCKTPRIPRKRLEEQVLATIREYILLPDNLTAIHQMTAVNLDEFEAERAKRRMQLSDERQSLSKRIANITAAIAAAGHSQAMLDELGRLETQRAQLIQEAEQLKVPVQPLLEVSFHQMAVLSDSLIDKLTNGTPEEVRATLRGFIQQVRAQKKDGAIVGTITYFYPPINAPPFDPAPMLSIARDPVGAPRYRQTFTYPIVNSSL